jgi:hypothetical protein
MTVEEFHAAGLEKLSSSELSALDAWFTRTVGKLLAGAGSPSPGNSAGGLDFSAFEGATIVADDGQFLGKITTNSLDAQSIGNDLGRYGSTLSSTSILNDLSRYGGELARMSPFNSLTSTPPRVFKGDRFLGYLAVNNLETPRIDPRALIGWIKSNQ